MFTPKKEDINHKIQLLRLLRSILSNNLLSNNLMFKGGTYASLRGVLDRFSTDLDFDLPDDTFKSEIRDSLYEIFNDLGLLIKDESKNHLQFFLKYDTPQVQRNTLKLEINDRPSKFNEYESVSLLELNTYCRGHTLDTMFANKLIAAKSRFDKTGKISGRDFYDIHNFFTQGLEINKKVVEDLSKMSYKEYIESLFKFIKDNVDTRLLNEDLNPLVDSGKLNTVLPHLKDELLLMLEKEIH
ncbi:nucleotidyl transferase AbiEii/AbiGii toxin family protein [Patescibacteria group bacterium]|nr:nucleotidyl transferase AbiEii/AbiGii toxin family protein [Patescibacteria group bacterium]